MTTPTSAGQPRPRIQDAYTSTANTQYQTPVDAFGTQGHDGHTFNMNDNSQYTGSGFDPAAMQHGQTNSPYYTAQQMDEGPAYGFPLSDQRAASRQPRKASGFFNQRSAPRNIFTGEVGCIYYSLVFVALGVIFTSPNTINDATTIKMINRLLSYGERSKISEFVPRHLDNIKLVFATPGPEIDSFIAHLREMWDDAPRQMEWVVNGLHNGFKHGAFPDMGLDISAYNTDSGFMSRYLGKEKEYIDTATTCVWDWKSILIDLIAEAVQCDVIRPGHTDTDTWSNNHKEMSSGSGRRPDKSKRAVSRNTMPNLPLFNSQASRHIPDVQERAAQTIASLTHEQKLRIASKLKLYQVAGNMQMPTNRNLSPGVPDPRALSASRLNAAQSSTHKRQRTEDLRDEHVNKKIRTPPSQPGFTDPFSTTPGSDHNGSNQPHSARARLQHTPRTAPSPRTTSSPLTVGGPLPARQVPASSTSSRPAEIDPHLNSMQPPGSSTFVDNFESHFNDDFNFDITAANSTTQQLNETYQNVTPAAESQQPAGI